MWCGDVGQVYKMCYYIRGPAHSTTHSAGPTNNMADNSSPQPPKSTRISGTILVTEDKRPDRPAKDRDEIVVPESQPSHVFSLKDQYR